MTKMSHADAAWLHMESPTNLMMINGLLFLSSCPKRQHLEAVLRYRLCCYQRFRMRAIEPRAGLGLPSWEPVTNFQVAPHLVYEDLPETNRAALLERCNQLMSEPLPRDRALWEFRVFPEVDGKAAILVRLHHAIGDGIALMRVLLTLCDETADAPWPCPKETCPESNKTPFQRAKKLASRWLHEAHDLMFHPSHVAEVAHQALSASKSLAHLLALPPDQASIFKGDLGTKKVTAVSDPIDLAAVKAVGKRLGYTINDVLMGVLAGALGRSLKRGQEVDESFQVRGVCPVDLRGGRVEELGNKFGLVFLGLPVGNPCARSRLRIVHENMKALKGSAEAVVAFELLSAVGAVPADIERRIIQWFGDKATAVVTNLPGPRERLFLAGTSLDSMMYWVPQSGRLALGISLLSYAGQITMGVASDANLIPHPEYIVEDFRASYDEIQSLEAP